MMNQSVKINDELLDIIDDNDQVLRQALRNEVYDQLLHHRIVHVLVFNSEGKLLLQQRAAHHKVMPLQWGSSVGGHVLAGESYEQAALRELQEELGLAVPLEMIGVVPHTAHHVFNFKPIKKHLGVFKIVHDGPFEPDPDECEQLVFASLEEVQQMVDRGEKIMPEFFFLLKHHFNIR